MMEEIITEQKNRFTNDRDSTSKMNPALGILQKLFERWETMDTTVISLRFE